MTTIATWTPGNYDYVEKDGIVFRIDRKEPLPNWEFINEPGYDTDSDKNLRELAAWLYSRGLIEYDANMFVTTENIRTSILWLIAELRKNINETSTEEEIQYWFYEAGKLHFLSNLRFWFRVLYRMVNDADSGPRFGAFIIMITLECFLPKLELFISPDIFNTLRDLSFTKSI